jgi:hypothetical protein
MREDSTYPRRFKNAEVQAARSLEDEAVRRAREGIRKSVLHRGKQVYVQGEPLFTTEYSDSLLIFLLKAYNPDRFRERIEQTILLDIDPDKLTPAQRDVIAQHLIKEAFADHPQLVAEARRRIEAGEASQWKRCTNTPRSVRGYLRICEGQSPSQREVGSHEHAYSLECGKIVRSTRLSIMLKGSSEVAVATQTLSHFSVPMILSKVEHFVRKP